jgi:hypothetical protein
LWKKIVISNLQKTQVVGKRLDGRYDLDIKKGANKDAVRGNSDARIARKDAVSDNLLDW